MDKEDNKMSYKTWITYGYGVKVSDLERKDITADDLANFIHLAPYLKPHMKLLQLKLYWSMKTMVPVMLDLFQLLKEC